MNPSRTSRWLLHISLIAALAFLPGTARKDSGDKGEGRPTRFKGLDLNNDGRVTRDEWHGSDRSFSVHDRNRDGVIAGNEAGDLPGIDRNHDGRISRNEWRWARADSGRIDDNEDGYAWSLADHVGAVSRGTLDTPVNTWTLPEEPQARFTRLDRDGNLRISVDEWDDDRNGFEALDENGDGTLSRAELRSVSEARRALFHVFDVDGDGLLSRREWQGDRHSFGRLDQNGDRRLMREEFITRSREFEKSFDELDRDQSGRLELLEWHGDKKGFVDLDDNHDGQISLAEFVGVN